MSFSFSIKSKSKSKSSRLKKPSPSFSVAFDNQAVTLAADASSTRIYVREFKPHELVVKKSKIQPIPPLPNEWPPHIKKLNNLPNLPSLSQTNGSDSSLQFELDPGSNPAATDNSIGYGLNLRQPPVAAVNGGPTAPDRRETRNAKEDIKVYEVAKKTGRDRLGCTGEFSDNRNGKAAENLGNANVEKNEN